MPPKYPIQVSNPGTLTLRAVCHSLEMVTARISSYGIELLSKIAVVVNIQDTCVDFEQ